MYVNGKYVRTETMWFNSFLLSPKIVYEIIHIFSQNRLAFFPPKFYPQRIRDQTSSKANRDQQDVHHNLPNILKLQMLPHQDHLLQIFFPATRNKVSGTKREDYEVPIQMRFGRLSEAGDEFDVWGSGGGWEGWGGGRIISAMYLNEIPFRWDYLVVNEWNLFSQDVNDD